MKKLSWLDQVLLKVGARMTKDPIEKRAMLTGYDNVKKEHVAEILSEVKNF